MANSVSHFKRTKTYRSTFRNLPKGAPYWLATDTTPSPSIKISNNTKMREDAARLFGQIGQTSIPDTQVAVIRVQDVYIANP